MHTTYLRKFECRLDLPPADGCRFDIMDCLTASTVKKVQRKISHMAEKGDM